jgi:hypothetical protein
MKSFIHGQKNRSVRRRGQALLLAVLLMVFAAILGATFVTIVSLNLSQTARTESKGESQAAAQAGLQFVDDRLVSEGLTWKQSEPPASGEPSYNFYYDDFDRAQGWDIAKFVKYPDPRAENTGTSANFMAKVEKVLLGAPDNADGSKTGALRVTVIGRATDNPAAFTRLVRYKAGVRQNAVGVAMRTITNWDFNAGEVPRGEVTEVGANFVKLKNVRGTFPVKAASDAYNGYAVMIGDPQTGIAPRALTVQSWEPIDKKLTFTQAFGGPTTAPITAKIGERVEMAATLGAPSFINYDNNTSIDVTQTAASPAELARFSVGGTITKAAKDEPAVGGVFSMGGLLWIGDARASLQSAQSASVPSTIKSTGMMQIQFDRPTTAPDTSSSAGKLRAYLTESKVTLAGQYRKSNANQTLASGTTLVDSSADADFPGIWTGTSGTLTAPEKAQMVDDGWNRLAGKPGATRSVAPIAAPKIDAARWRSVTRESDPAEGYNQTTAGLWDMAKAFTSIIATTASAWASAPRRVT